MAAILALLAESHKLSGWVRFWLHRVHAKFHECLSISIKVESGDRLTYDRLSDVTNRDIHTVPQHITSYRPYCACFTHSAVRFQVKTTTCSLFNDAFLDYTASNERVIGEWWTGKDVQVSSHGLILRYYPGICLEELRKTMKSLSQDSRSQGRDLNPGPPECEGVLKTTTVITK
jgi:hypothetical protein